MRRYETIVIVDPDLQDESRESMLEKLKGLIQETGGFFINVEDWGSRKLAYEIKKKQRGYYTLINYCGSGAFVNEMERLFQIDDQVLKYMTVVLDKAPDLDTIKAEMAKAVQAKEEASDPEVAVPSVEADTPADDTEPESQPEKAAEETPQTEDGQEE